MNEKQGNEIDEIFRKGLAEADIPFDEAHWRDMNKKLHQDGNRRRDILLWASMGGVAAMLLMTLTWWFIQPVPSQPAPVKIQAQKQTGAATSPIADNNETDAAIITNEGQIQPNINVRVIGRDGTTNPSSEITVIQPDQAIPVQKTETVAEPVRGNTEIAQNNINTTSAENSPVIETNKLALQDISPVIQSDSSRISVRKHSGFKPEFVLTINAASDLSAVNSFTGVKSGSGGGVLATVSLSPKFGFTTGIQLGRKIYQTGFANYRPVTNYIFPVKPALVDADCKVLDIPLNLNYIVWNKGSNRIEVSAGASSYFMLKEKYEFIYQNPGRNPGHYQVSNRNRHFMGVGNIAVSYEKKLNKNLGIAIQPYAKLPLTEIGFGNVKLISAGVSANLNINISKIAGQKP